MFIEKYNGIPVTIEVPFTLLSKNVFKTA